MPANTKPAVRWHAEIPGTRWFRADLHLHTLDDHAGGRVERPAGLSGDATDPAVLRVYARHVLQAAIARNVEVLAFTPHDVRTGPNTSAVWEIVETWATQQDDDGRPFKDKIYAVFPGFEPSINFGKRGVHFLFLFDPSIGRERYLRLFDALMGGVSPWADGQLRISGLNDSRIFTTLDDFHKRENPPALSEQIHPQWDYLLLAPHAFADNGIFGGAQGQVLGQFPSDRLTGLELHDNQMPDSACANRRWLLPEMRRLHQAFYHASDAYGTAPAPSSDALFKVGSRVTVLKMHAPTIEALRQAFIGADARLRLAYVHGAPGTLVPDPAVPTAVPFGRKWIREVTVPAGTSFHAGQTFRLSPDLTCVIGGSMTGKSTFLDGLRRVIDAPMPGASYEALRREVEARAGRFIGIGNGPILVQSPAADPAKPLSQQFGARFFSQGELRTLADDDDGVEHLIFHLVPGLAAGLVQQREQLRAMDEDVRARAHRLAQNQEKVAEAEQAFERAKQARAAMERFAKAGTGALNPANQDETRARDFSKNVEEQLAGARELEAGVTGVSMPVFTAAELRAHVAAREGSEGGDALLGHVREWAAGLVESLEALQRLAVEGRDLATAHQADVLHGVQASLVAAGGSAADLTQFDSYAKAAQLFDSYEAVLTSKAAEQDRALEAFIATCDARDKLVCSHQASIASVCQQVGERFDGRVRIQVDIEARNKALDDWIRGIRHQGVTRWWNDQQGVVALSRLRAAALANNLLSVGMSEAVVVSFKEQIAPWRRTLELMALRSLDRYRIQWQEGGTWKDVTELSGGRRIAVLLTLLLESDDTSPLFIDQPEDELDNRFLNQTIIPALHRLKGKRQVVFATHSANLVVNADADNVLVLEADASHAWLTAEGAIEDHAVQEAIVRVLDGGEDAFKLRKLKYGY